MEIWRDINGYEGLYQVSDKGNVKSLISGKFLKQFSNYKGYMRVGLYKNHKCSLKSVHRLVADAFIPNEEMLPFINHKDENPVNNSVENLEWCTVRYNNTYGNRIEKAKEKQINNPFKSKKVLQFYLNGVLKSEYPSMSEAVRDNPECNVAEIGRCCNGGRVIRGKWVNYNKHKNYIWRYG